MPAEPIWGLLVNRDGAVCKEGINIKVSFSILGSTQSRICFDCCCHQTMFNPKQIAVKEKQWHIRNLLNYMWYLTIWHSDKPAFINGRKWVSSERTDLYEKSVLRWLIHPWIWLFNCIFRESSVTQRRWPQRHLVAVETSQCDCVSMSSVLCEHIWQKKRKKKKKTICGLNRFLSLPNLREWLVWAAWQTICASVVSFVFSAFSIFFFFFLNQSASSSLRPSPPFSVPACWFNQDKQLGTRSVELVSKPRLIYWLPGPPLYLTG